VLAEGSRASGSGILFDGGKDEDRWFGFLVAGFRLTSTCYETIDDHLSNTRNVQMKKGESEVYYLCLGVEPSFCENQSV
jgi:hypothetical protein